VWLFVFGSVSFNHFSLSCIAVCDINLCPESSVSCAPGLSLVRTAVPGHCCPQHHCGTHIEKHAHTHAHMPFVTGVKSLMGRWLQLTQKLLMPVTYLHRFHTTFLFNSLTPMPRMPMWGQQPPHMSGGKSAKSCIRSHCQIMFLPESEHIQLSQHFVFSQGEVLVEVPDSSTNCGCPQHTCRMCNSFFLKYRNPWW